MRTALRLITAAVLLTVALLADMGTASAKAVQKGEAWIDHPTPHKVYAAEYRTKKKSGKRVLWVQFFDMSTWRFTACKFEDSKNCYWDAQTMGNGKGKSFVDLGGKTIRLPKSRLLRSGTYAR